MIFPVIGVMRSGTSLTAGILHQLGIVMGERFTWSDSEWCPTGMYCDDEMLGLLSPESINLAGLAEAIGTREERYKRWGFKSHYLPLLWSDFLSVCQADINLVCTSRDRGESIRSWSARTGTSQAEAESYLQPWFDCVPRIYDTFPGPKLLVDYARLVESPDQELARIAAFAGVQVTLSARELVRPEHYRYRSK